MTFLSGFLAVGMIALIPCFLIWVYEDCYDFVSKIGEP